MKNLRTSFMMMGMLAATTVGAGIFTLPWIFHNAGWARASLWLVILSAMVAFAGYSYWRTLAATEENLGLVGLTRKYLGRDWGTLATIGVVGGMLFALIIYLVLAQRFLAILLPLSPTAALVMFWALAIFPATFNIRRFAMFENTGTFLKCALIVFVFFSAANYDTIFASSTPVVPEFLFPFGAILFAMTGWNAIEPMRDLWNSRKDSGRVANPLSAIVFGTAGIAVLYFLFSAGILGSLGGGSFLSPDTLSGLIGWPFWKMATLAVLGLLALWTAYGINALGVENALRKDLGWNQNLAFATVALIPLLVVFSGLVSLIQAITFAGAVFISIQYVCILTLAAKVLQPGSILKWTMYLSGAVFAAAALYEIYVFVVV